MELEKPQDSNESLAWLGAAMSQNRTDGITNVAHMFALFYDQLTADGMLEERAAQLTEVFMLWQLDNAAKRMGQ